MLACHALHAMHRKSQQGFHSSASPPLLQAHARAEELLEHFRKHQHRTGVTVVSDGWQDNTVPCWALWLPQHMVLQRPAWEQQRPAWEQHADLKDASITAAQAKELVGCFRAR